MLTLDGRPASATAESMAARIGNELSRHGLVALARSQWPSSDVDTLPSLPGFVGSPFAPTVAHVSQVCLRQAYGEPPLPAAAGERVGVLIVSSLGDVTSALDVARRVREGDRVGPLLFFQSVPHAVAGFIAARWGLGGPVVCLSTRKADLEAAALLIADGDADRVLVVVAEEGRGAAALVTGGGS